MAGFLVFFLIIIFCCFLVLSINKNKDGKVQLVEEPQPQKESDEEIKAKAERLVAMAELARQAKEYGDMDTFKAVNEMWYDGELPRKLPDGSWEDVYANRLRFKIAGINYREGISDLVGKCKGYVIPDPKNEFDPNALKIITAGNVHVGFIPKDRTDDFRQFVMDKFPADVTIYITKFENGDGEETLSGTVFVEKK